ncbi:MAG TPA: tetratricopeptide repeat protein [Stellaceae bacterium]|nr:tetratricopeptide repeat protein [Stellaceae bacterium]
MRLKALACLFCAGLLALSRAPPARAGLPEGLAAYQRGEYGEAFRQLDPLAVAGNPVAQYTVARMYLAGQGVARDAADGLRWLRRAARSGLAGAQYQLAARYQFGIDLPRDYARAAAWYRKAADRGFAAAQFRLGVLYMNGLGVARDPVVAHMWLNLAIAQLPPGPLRDTAATLRENLAQKMSAAEIARAQLLARAWRPLAEGCREGGLPAAGGSC